MSGKKYIQVTYPLTPKCVKDIDAAMEKAGLDYNPGFIPGTKLDPATMKIGVGHGYIEVSDKEKAGVMKKLASMKETYEWLNF